MKIQRFNGPRRIDEASLVWQPGVFYKATLTVRAAGSRPKRSAQEASREAHRLYRDIKTSGLRKRKSVWYATSVSVYVWPPNGRGNE